MAVTMDLAKQVLSRGVLNEYRKKKLGNVKGVRQ
jgi:hypothetical protein